MFNTGCISMIPQAPAEPLEVRETLSLAVCAALNPNWALRNVEQFEFALEGLDDVVNESELYGIIQASEEGPRCPRYVSLRMQLALMHYFFRICVDFLCFQMIWEFADHQFYDIVCYPFVIPPTLHHDIVTHPRRDFVMKFHHLGVEDVSSKFLHTKQT